MTAAGFQLELRRRPAERQKRWHGRVTRLRFRLPISARDELRRRLPVRSLGRRRAGRLRGSDAGHGRQRGGEESVRGFHVLRIRVAPGAGRDVPLNVQLRSIPTANHERLNFDLLGVVTMTAPDSRTWATGRRLS